jgi:hypothetical protein
MVINEASNSQLLNGRLSGLQPGLDSSLLQSDISQKSYMNKYNELTISSKKDSSKIYNTNNNIIANQSF